MDIGKVFEHGIAVLRANICLLTNKIWNTKRVRFNPKSRMFARSEVVIRDYGSVEFGANLKIGKNSMLTAQGGNIIIGNGVGINRDVLINSHEQITIGDNTVIAPRVCIYDHDHLYDNEHGVNKKEFKSAPIVIGKNVWIGANAIILRGSKIGDNCVVGAGSVIKGEFPAGTVIVQKRETEICRGG